MQSEFGDAHRLKGQQVDHLAIEVVFPTLSNLITNGTKEILRTFEVAAFYILEKQLLLIWAGTLQVSRQ